MRTVMVAAAVVLGLINIASANQPVHLHCAPKTTEIRVFLNQFSVTRGNWRDLATSSVLAGASLLNPDTTEQPNDATSN